VITLGYILTLSVNQENKQFLKFYLFSADVPCIWDIHCTHCYWHINVNYKGKLRLHCSVEYKGWFTYSIYSLKVSACKNPLNQASTVYVHIETIATR